MRILLTRTRIGMEPPSYSFRVYVPFTEISLERQALISMHSDYGMGAGLLARLPDVIAPMSHLESAPGLDKHNLGKRIDGVAARLGAILLARIGEIHRQTNGVVLLDRVLRELQLDIPRGDVHEGQPRLHIDLPAGVVDQADANLLRICGRADAWDRSISD